MERQGLSQAFAFDGHSHLFGFYRRLERVLLSRRLAWLSLIVICAAATAAWSVWQLQYSPSLTDEGFLWYGVRQVMHGQVPLRDFESYDPGRYYSFGLLLDLWANDGLLALRVLALAFISMAVLGIAVLVWSAEKPPTLAFLAVTSLTLVPWLLPYFYKVHDYLACTILLLALAWLAHRRDLTAYFLAGAAVGLAAFVGRNHGLYGAFGSLFVIGWIRLSREGGPALVRTVAAWSGGVMVGYAPVIWMLLFVPGFARALWETIVLMFAWGATNVALPIPWPWTTHATSLVWKVRLLGVGIGFMALLSFAFVGPATVLMQRLRGRNLPPAFIAAAALSIPYAHYAFSRADIDHLSLSILPLMVGLFVVLGRCRAWIRIPSAIMVLLASVWITLTVQPGYECVRSPICVSVDISGDSFRTDPKTAADIQLVRTLSQEYAPNQQPFLAVPIWPTIYPIFGRSSPIWEIYPLITRPRAFEEREIQSLQTARPGFVVVSHQKLNDLEGMQFALTHPHVYSYIIANFDRVEEFSNDRHDVFKARSN